MPKDRSNEEESRPKMSKTLSRGNVRHMVPDLGEQPIVPLHKMKQIRDFVAMLQIDLQNEFGPVLEELGVRMPSIVQFVDELGFCEIGDKAEPHVIQALRGCFSEPL